MCDEFQQDRPGGRLSDIVYHLVCLLERCMGRWVRDHSLVMYTTVRTSSAKWTECFRKVRYTLPHLHRVSVVSSSQSFDDVPLWPFTDDISSKIFGYQTTWFASNFIKCNFRKSPRAAGWYLIAFQVLSGRVWCSQLIFVEAKAKKR